jgi:hypothetical protein
MSRARSLANLLTDVRQRAQMENSPFVTDSELTEWINQSIAELYDLLVAARGQEYYLATTASQNTVPGIDTYSLPADFYQLLGVDVTLNASDVVALKPYMFQERNAYKIAGIWSAGTPIFYRLKAGNISFIPNPTGAYPFVLHYIPVSQRLLLPNDAFDGINGWEEYVVVDAAAKALEKEESDASSLYKRKAERAKQIEGLAPARDAGHPERVTDVHESSGRWWRA